MERSNCYVDKIKYNISFFKKTIDNNYNIIII